MRTLADALRWDPMVAALAAQRPGWEPRTTHGYHAQTFGWLVGEVIRRVDGRSLGQFLADEIAAPLSLDLHIGLPDAQRSRVSRLIDPDPQRLRDSEPPDAVRRGVHPTDRVIAGKSGAEVASGGCGRSRGGTRCAWPRPPPGSLSRRWPGAASRRAGSRPPTWTHSTWPSEWSGSTPPTPATVGSPSRTPRCSPRSGRPRARPRTSSRRRSRTTPTSSPGSPAPARTGLC